MSSLSTWPKLACFCMECVIEDDPSSPEWPSRRGLAAKQRCDNIKKESAKPLVVNTAAFKNSGWQPIQTVDLLARACEATEIKDDYTELQELRKAIPRNHQCTKCFLVFDPSHGGTCPQCRSREHRLALPGQPCGTCPGLFDASNRSASSTAPPPGGNCNFREQLEEF